MPKTMRAVVLTHPVTSDQLTVTDVPVPDVRPGWVRIRVKAFGVNESEVTSRKGESDPDFTFPRILGIEGVGIVDTAPEGSGFKPGQKVATMMGGMGRGYDGSYAEYTLVPEGQIIPFDTDLPWETVGALPEMFQTAYGSLTTGLGLRSRQTLLIRGGTSTVGLSATALAKDMGATVLSTTRRPERAMCYASTARTTPSSTTASSPTAYGNCARTGSMRPWSWSGGLRCPTRSVRSAQAERSASPVHCQANGPSPTSAPSPSSPSESASPCTAEGKATCRPLFDHQLRSIAEGRLKPAIAKVHHGLDQVLQAHNDLEADGKPGKHVVVLD